MNALMGLAVVEAMDAEGHAGETAEEREWVNRRMVEGVRLLNSMHPDSWTDEWVLAEFTTSDLQSIHTALAGAIVSLSRCQSHLTKALSVVVSHCADRMLHEAGR